MSLHLKQNVLFVAYLLFNVSLTYVLIALEYGYLLVAFFVVGGHLRDVLNIVYQLINMSKILRRPPDVPPGDVNTICCLVPVYNEQPALFKKNLDGLTTQNLSANTKVLVVVVFDGLGDKTAHLFEFVNRLVDFDPGSGEREGERWYLNWKTREFAKLVFKVGRYRSTTVIVSYKQKNSGKKDSLIIGERFITTGIPEIEAVDAPKVDFIYHTDGDTSSDENCLNEMLKSLVHDKDLDGVSGFLRTYLKEGATCTERGFVMMQDFQYFFSLIVRRMTESLMKSTVCLPGCSNMIRISERTDVAIEKYGNLPASSESFLQAVTRMQGTDRRYTTLLLRQGCNLQMSWRAFVHTEPPLDATSFVNQRRRWSSNSFFNSIVVLYSSNISLYIRASSLIDIGRVFSTLFRFVSYFCFWIFVNKLSVTNLVFFSIFIALPYIYAFTWILCIVPEWKQMIAGFFLNKTFMPFLSVVAVTKMYFTSTNFSWASTST
ncbi:unnamed protein product, partial [Ectocarpus sp. 12 AP-2014]